MRLSYWSRRGLTFTVPDAIQVPSPRELEQIAISVALQAASIVRAGWGSATSVGTKSSATDVVTQTDLDAERLIRDLLIAATPGCGIVGEEGGTLRPESSLQWVVDPLDGTVNFLYGVPIFAVSIGAAVAGEFVAGAVIDVMRGEVFSAALGEGARLDGKPIRCSPAADLGTALVVTGYSYTPRLRAIQGELVCRLLPVVRDVRCFGSAALQLCWIACGRADAYFERDIKIWDWAAGSLIATEAGATVDFPCPENDGLVMSSAPGCADLLREHVAHEVIGARPKSTSVDVQ
jgi:myo-inositol-1(or 4)-monophosphatase